MLQLLLSHGHSEQGTSIDPNCRRLDYSGVARKHNPLHYSANTFSDLNDFDTITHLQRPTDKNEKDPTTFVPNDTTMLHTQWMPIVHLGTITGPKHQSLGWILERWQALETACEIFSFAFVE
eukprot:scaffold276_cov132-Cylindrotheca_fusiformis.AAC.11